MTSTTEMYQGGAHRGGTAFANAFFAGNGRPLVRIADPVPGRAGKLAQFLQRRYGVGTVSQEAPIESAVAAASDDAVVMLATDSPSAMRTVVEGRRHNPIQWQALLRVNGVGGQVLGLAGSLTPGDAMARESSERLLKGLAAFSESSREIWGASALRADSLFTMRDRLSRHSAERVRMLDEAWDPADMQAGALNLYYDYGVFTQRPPLPLVVRELPGDQSLSRLEARALDFEWPGTIAEYGAAFVGSERIELLVVERLGPGRRGVRYHGSVSRAPTGQAAVTD